MCPVQDLLVRDDSAVLQGAQCQQSKEDEQDSHNQDWKAEAPVEGSNLHAECHGNCVASKAR